MGPSKDVTTSMVDEEGNIYGLEKACFRVFLDSEGEFPMGDVNTLLKTAPNLALNVENAIVPSHTLWAWASLGVILQMFATAFPGIATYYQEWNKAGGPIASYGYPCFLLGTICLSIGMLLCGHIIEGSTTETQVRPGSEIRQKKGVRFITEQQQNTVGDQNFPLCIILHASNDGTFKMSNPKDKNYE